jgi:endonuclease/exonuclease/phosphatase family metal-dependent hydrolase
VVAASIRLLSRASLALCAVLLLAGCVSSRPFSDAGSQITNANRDDFDGRALTVVTYNMLHGYGDRLNDRTVGERLALLARGIEGALPDIVVLQEASVTPGRHGNVVDVLRETLNDHLRPAGISYNSVCAMANGSRIIGFFEGSAILSRFRILSADTLVYRDQALIPPEHRIALRTRIGSKAPAPRLTIVSTHLTNTEARRGRALKRTLQARELAGWLGTSGGPGLSIIGGDFNDIPDSSTVRAMLDSGAVDAWVSVRKGGAAGAANEGAGPTGLSGTVTDPTDVADDRIDYIFVKSGTAVVTRAAPFLDHPFARDGGGVLWASDHIGVLARIEPR